MPRILAQDIPLLILFSKQRIQPTGRKNFLFQGNSYIRTCTFMVQLKNISNLPEYSLSRQNCHGQQNPLECNVDSFKYLRQIYSLIYAAAMATKGDQRIFYFSNAASRQGRTTQTSKEGAQLKFLYLHQFEPC